MAFTETSEGVGARLSIDGKKYCVVKIDPKDKFTFVDPNGELMCGSYSHYAERVALGPRMVRLNALLEPTPEEWDDLLPLIGYTESTDVFTPTDALTSFNAQVDWDGAAVGTFSTGVVDVAVARGQQGLSPVSLELQMIFQDVSIAASGWTGTSHDLNAPYEFTAGSLEIPTSTSLRFNSFVWVHDNQVRQRFNNSTTADNLPNTQRIIHLGTNTPYATAAEKALVADAVGQSTRLAGKTAQLSFTRSPQSLVFDFANMKTESGVPKVLGKSEEIRNTQFWKCYATASDPECTITSTLS